MNWDAKVKICENQTFWINEDGNPLLDFTNYGEVKLQDLSIFPNIVFPKEIWHFFNLFCIGHHQISFVSSIEFTFLQIYCNGYFNVLETKWELAALFRYFIG